MQAWRSSLPQGFRVGFAPTMGNLHAGHLSLVEKGEIAKRRHCRLDIR
jgi:pantothenate synthetase